ncbi:MAG: hypothetical protein HY069_02575 [Chlamydiia bacterium]|nr:hypothetical protein [Chlamydiia bacterium]
MRQMEGKQMRVADYIVRKYRRLAIKLSLEDARIISATKMEEVVDKEKIKELHRQGDVIPGVSEFEYISVALVKPMGG